MKYLLPIGALLPLTLSHCTCPDDYRQVPQPRVGSVAQVYALTDCQIRHYGTTLLADAPTPEVARALLARGAQPVGTIIRNGQAETGSAVAQTANERVLRVLLDAGADANIGGGSTHRNALCNAAATGSTQAVSMLLASGADPNRIDSRGESPLYLAATNMHIDACNLLLTHGAPPDYGRTTDGESPLMGVLKSAADSEQKIGIAQVLLAGGASPLLTDADGNTPLHFAPAALVPTLLAAGANVQARNYLGRTPIFYCNNLQQAQTLIEAGADVNTTDYHGNKPFDVITNAQVKAYLLTRGAVSGSAY